MNEEHYERFSSGEYPPSGQGAFGPGMNIRIGHNSKRVRKIIAFSLLGGVALTVIALCISFFVIGRFMHFDVEANATGFSISVTPKGAEAADPGKDQTEALPPDQAGPDAGSDQTTEAVGTLKPTGQGDASVVISDKDPVELTNPQIAQRVKPSVVGILGESLRFASSGTGSGIIMSEDGYIITNYHVVENVDKITVVLDNGTEYNAIIIGEDEKSDLAVIKINATGLTPVEFGNSDRVVVADRAMAIGNPFGLELQGTVTVGIISAINRDIAVSEERIMTLIQTDASINPGNSGGPLVNKYGQVIGINTIKLGVSYFEGLGFAIPINTAKPILEDLIRYGRVQGRPAIGITGWVVTESYAQRLGRPMGVYVETVDEKSGASEAGVAVGDIITRVNNRKVSTMADINKEKERLKVGDTIRLTVDREGKEQEFDVRLVDESMVS